jgi:hypothetical protein
LKTESNKLIFFIIAVVLLATTALYMFSGSRSLTWERSYSPDDKNPYGVSILYNLMTKIRGNQEFHRVEDSLHQSLSIDPTQKVDNYIFIGRSLYADSTDTRRLLDFVRNGNRAFIFTEEPLNMVFDSLIQPGYEEYETGFFSNDEIPEEENFDQDLFEEVEEYKDTSSVQYFATEYSKRTSGFSDSAAYYSLTPEPKEKIYAVKYLEDFEARSFHWRHFSSGLKMRNGEAVIIKGHLGEYYPNYIECKVGSGKIVFHSSPLIFTNYHMLNDKPMNYARTVLNELGDGAIFWDEENRTFHFLDKQNNSLDNNENPPTEGPLEFILSEPALRTAWYVMLACVALYLIFGARRKQRIIQTISGMENTSIEYTETISQMFMKEKDHSKLILLKMDLFLSFVRERYNLKISRNDTLQNDKLMAEISTRSNIPAEHVKNIFQQHIYLISLAEVKTEDMLSFHNKLEYFYSNCK